MVRSPKRGKAYDIAAFIAARGLKAGAYVVIDDEAIAIDGLVQTDEDTGLSAADADAIVGYFGPSI